MATAQELKSLANKRRLTVISLMNAQEWDVAAYMMAHTLEYALKAAICKTLKLNSYPPLTQSGAEVREFKIHDFERLLILSGLRDVFSISGKFGLRPYQNWSDFTLEFPSEWVILRYDDASHRKYNESKVKSLYNSLYSDPESILKTIAGKRRW